MGRMLKSLKVLLVLVWEKDFWLNCYSCSLEICEKLVSGQSVNFMPISLTSISLKCSYRLQKYMSFGNNLALKYQYNLAFYVFTGKLLYLPLFNSYDGDSPWGSRIQFWSFLTVHTKLPSLHPLHQNNLMKEGWEDTLTPHDHDLGIKVHFFTSFLKQSISHAVLFSI